jgi:hypothetical protein
MENHSDNQRKGGTKTETGGCHCGAIRFEVDVDVSAGAHRCNCSICNMVAHTSSIVKPVAFRVLTDETKASIYEWGGKTMQRFFCTTCGIHCYGRGNLPELGGDYVSVNFNCLDGVDPAELTVTYFDGRHNNWEAGLRSTPWPIFTPAARAAG